MPDGWDEDTPPPQRRSVHADEYRVANLVAALHEVGRRNREAIKAVPRSLAQPGRRARFLALRDRLRALRDALDLAAQGAEDMAGE